MVRRGAIGLAAGSMLDQPADTVIDVAARAGFDAVGLRLSGEHHHDRPDELRRRAAGVGVDVFDVEVYRVSSLAVNPEPLLDAAASVGASAVLAVSDVADLDVTRAALASLSRECVVGSLRLGVEYMAWTTPSDVESVIEVADAVDALIVVDVLHHVRLGLGVSELTAIVDSGRLGWVQLCDAASSLRSDASTHAPSDDPTADLVDEARHRRRPPGHGDLPLRDLLACVPDDVPVSVEVQSDDLLAIDPLERAVLLRRAARSILDA